MKDKIQALTKYVDDLISKSKSQVPKKWQHAPDSYKAFLKREIDYHMQKIQDLKK